MKVCYVLSYIRVTFETSGFHGHFIPQFNFMTLNLNLWIFFLILPPHIEGGRALHDFCAKENEV